MSIAKGTPAENLPADKAVFKRELLYGEFIQSITPLLSDNAFSSSLVATQSLLAAVAPFGDEIGSAVANVFPTLVGQHLFGPLQNFSSLFKFIREYQRIWSKDPLQLPAEYSDITKDPEQFLAAYNLLSDLSCNSMRIYANAQEEGHPATKFDFSLCPTRIHRSRDLFEIMNEACVDINPINMSEALDLQFPIKSAPSLNDIAYSYVVTCTDVISLFIGTAAQAGSKIMAPYGEPIYCKGKIDSPPVYYIPRSFVSFQAGFRVFQVNDFGQWSNIRGDVVDAASFPLVDLLSVDYQSTLAYDIEDVSKTIITLVCTSVIPEVKLKVYAQKEVGEDRDHKILWGIVASQLDNNTSGLELYLYPVAAKASFIEKEFGVVSLAVHQAEQILPTGLYRIEFVEYKDGRLTVSLPDRSDQKATVHLGVPSITATYLSTRSLLTIGGVPGKQPLVSLMDRLVAEDAKVVIDWTNPKPSSSTLELLVNEVLRGYPFRYCQIKPINHPPGCFTAIRDPDNALKWILSTKHPYEPDEANPIFNDILTSNKIDMDSSCTINPAGLKVIFMQEEFLTKHVIILSDEDVAHASVRPAVSVDFVAATNDYAEATRDASADLVGKERFFWNLVREIKEDSTIHLFPAGHIRTTVKVPLHSYFEVAQKNIYKVDDLWTLAGEEKPGKVIDMIGERYRSYFRTFVIDLFNGKKKAISVIIDNSIVDFIEKKQVIIVEIFGPAAITDRQEIQFRDPETLEVVKKDSVAPFYMLTGGEIFPSDDGKQFHQLEYMLDNPNMRYEAEVKFTPVESVADDKRKWETLKPAVLLVHKSGPGIDFLSTDDPFGDENKRYILHDEVNDFIKSIWLTTASSMSATVKDWGDKDICGVILKSVLEVFKRTLANCETVMKDDTLTAYLRLIEGDGKRRNRRLGSKTEEKVEKVDEVEKVEKVESGGKDEGKSRIETLEEIAKNVAAIVNEIVNNEIVKTAVGTAFPEFQGDKVKIGEAYPGNVRGLSLALKEYEVAEDKILEFAHNSPVPPAIPPSGHNTPDSSKNKSKSKTDNKSKKGGNTNSTGHGSINASLNFHTILFTTFLTYILTLLL